VKENEFGLTKYLFHTSKRYLTCHKTHNIGLSALLPSEKRSADFYNPQKFIALSWVLMREP
jgi:hypothetical protein